MDNWNQFSLGGIGEEIKEILYSYVKAESITYSSGEKQAESFFLSYFKNQPYWQEHPECVGTKPVKDDPFGRAASFAMVRGKGDRTIVFVHHNDVVTVEDYDRLRPLAFSPDELEVELKKRAASFSEEIRNDLESDAYLYGRGVCDMKGGGSIQMALLRRYSELVRRSPEALPGNLIVLAVPDEENLSAGMRAAVKLLAELKAQYGFTYQLMINSEPHQRKDPETGVFSMGSVGKLMPFFYIRGYLAHVGKVFEGFNPMGLLSAIVQKTEVNMDLSDIVGNEAAPPPTWLFCRDRKIKYDVSMPLSAAGCLSVLTLNQTPVTLMEKVKGICEEAFDEVLDKMNRNYARFLEATHQPVHKLPWSRKVVDFMTLYEDAKAAGGEAFEREYRSELKTLQQKLENNEMTLLDCNFALLDFVYGYITDLSPRVVYGLIPPYYPNVSNRFITGLAPQIRSLDVDLDRFTRERFGQHYVSEEFYTGISDLSYTSISNSEEISAALSKSMPFYGTLYDIAISDIETISMPCINIGPWGKDFHKLTERVLKQDLCSRTSSNTVRTVSNKVVTSNAGRLISELHSSRPGYFISSILYNHFLDRKH